MDESALGFWPLAGGVVSSLPPHFLSLPSCFLFLGFIFFFFLPPRSCCELGSTHRFTAAMRRRCSMVSDVHIKRMLVGCGSGGDSYDDDDECNAYTHADMPG